MAREIGPKTLAGVGELCALGSKKVPLLRETSGKTTLVD